MVASQKPPTLIAAWTGQVNSDWKEKAEILLKLLDEYVTYSFNGVGNFTDLKIVSKTTTSQMTFNVDTKDRTRGTLKNMDDDTYVFLLFLMALSKLAPFNLTDEDSTNVRISCNPDNPFFKNLIVDPVKLEALGVLLGITITDKQRMMKGAAAFF